MTIRTISPSALALAGLCSALPAQAVPIFGQDFQLNDVAAYGESFIQLTRSDMNFDRGSAFMTTPLSLAGNSFAVAFSFRILGGTSGADGFTLAFQNIDASYVALAGGNLGFYPVRGGDGRPLRSGEAYAIAFDTFRNTAITGILTTIMSRPSTTRPINCATRRHLHGTRRHLHGTSTAAMNSSPGYCMTPQRRRSPST